MGEGILAGRGHDWSGPCLICVKALAVQPSLLSISRWRGGSPLLKRHDFAHPGDGGGRWPASVASPAAKRTTRPGVASGQPDRGFGCTDRRQGTGGARPLRAERLPPPPVVSDPSLRSLAKPGQPGSGGRRGGMGESLARCGIRFPSLTFAPSSGRPASPSMARMPPTFFSLLPVGRHVRTRSDPLCPSSSLGHCASNVRAGQEAAPSAAWCQSASLALAIPSGRRIQVARLPGIPAPPPSRSETALKLGSKLRDNSQTLS